MRLIKKETIGEDIILHCEIDIEKTIHRFFKPDVIIKTTEKRDYIGTPVVKGFWDWRLLPDQVLNFDISDMQLNSWARYTKNTE